MFTGVGGGGLAFDWVFTGGACILVGWVKSAPWNRMKFDCGLNCMAICIYVLFHYLHACLSKCQTCL